MICETAGPLISYALCGNHKCAFAFKLYFFFDRVSGCGCLNKRLAIIARFCLCVCMLRQTFVQQWHFFVITT